jgi:hypothetical protein
VRTPFFAALAALVALAGCSSDDEAASTLPDVTSTLSPSGTPSPTPSPSSTAELEAEVTAFFEDYIDTVNESWTSEKALERRREMFEDTCSDCLAGYLFAKRAHDENLTITGDDAELVTLELASESASTMDVVATERLPAGELLDPDGNVMQTFDEVLNGQTLYAIAKTEGGSWTITHSEAL